MPRFALCALALQFLAGAAVADPFASDWAPAFKSSARLVAGDGLRAGVEIKLSPGAITYWRDPGDAGLPPTFDFSRSDNLASATVDYPAPKRIAEADGGVAIGYDSGVVLPIRIAPIDPAKPVALNLALTYAVCEKICLPARADLTLTVRPNVSSPFGAAVDGALAKAPTALAADQVRIGEGGKRLCLDKAAGQSAFLLLEGPPGWRANGAPDPQGDGCFFVNLVEKPALSAGKTRVRLTFVGTGQAYQTDVDLADLS